MTRKRIIALLGIVGLVALVLAAPWRSASGGSRPSRWWRPRPCKPGGTYTGKDAGGCTWNQTLIPCDPACNRMTAVVKFANISPVGPGFPLCPDTEFRTDLVGNLVRTGRNTWDFTWIGYGVEKPPLEPDESTGYSGRDNLYAWPLTYIIVMSGTQTFTDGGDHVTYEIAMGIWLPENDDDPADGVPDEGVEPSLLSNPEWPEPGFTTTGTRLPLVPR